MSDASIVNIQHIRKSSIRGTIFFTFLFLAFTTVDVVFMIGEALLSSWTSPPLTLSL